MLVRVRLFVILRANNPSFYLKRWEYIFFLPTLYSVLVLQWILGQNVKNMVFR